MNVTMKAILIVLCVIGICMVVRMTANSSTAVDERTTSGQTIDLKNIGAALDGIQDPASKKTALDLIGDHQDLLMKVKQGGLNKLIKHGIAKNVKQRRSSTPIFQVKSERTATSTTVTLYEPGDICLSRPEIELYLNQGTSQLRALIVRFNDHASRIVLWDEKGRINENAVVKVDNKKINSKEIKVIWPTLPIQVNTQDVSDQKKKIEETMALVNDVISLIKDKQGVVKYKLSIDQRYFSELDGWGKIKKIRFALQKTSPVSWGLGSVYIELAGGDIDAISVQVVPLMVSEIKDGKHIWWFGCDPAGKVIFVSKKP